MDDDAADMESEDAHMAEDEDDGNCVLQDEFRSFTTSLKLRELTNL